MTMKIRKIDMFLYKMYACYCDESVSYNDKQLSYKQWREKNKSLHLWSLIRLILKNYF